MKDITLIQRLMSDFKEHTLLSDIGKDSIRYLWTDAYAVCNFLSLFELTNEKKYLEDAITLVNEVHNVLGRYEKDDLRKGWISGLSEEEGKKHPTIGGLRIGKKLKERKENEAYDEDLEWERDGQYFHYLTKWMHALNCMSVVTRDFTYVYQAIELAKTACEKFTYELPLNHTKRMYWKMSIDLSRPLVSSMGQHDALDAFVVFNQLVLTQKELVHTHSLEQEISQMKAICQSITWMSADSLGIGGLLDDAFKLLQLIIYHKLPQERMLVKILAAAQEDLHAFMQTDTLTYPAKYRLAFRELGLAIGLHALEEMKTIAQKNSDILAKIKLLERYIPLYESIEEFWLKAENQDNATWKNHFNINSVMLATSLAPKGYLMRI